MTMISYHEEVKRKLVHLSSLWMAAATLLLPCWCPAAGRWIACMLFALLLLLTLWAEHDYANGGRFPGKLYGILFGKMLRAPVRPGQWVVSGAAPVLAAALMVNLIFPPFIAAASLGVMLIGDTAAALIGRAFGRHKSCNGKSWEGSLAFILAGYAACALLLFLGGASGICFLFAIPAVLLAAAAELFTKQLRIDDNFTIPLCSGMILAIGLLFA